MGLPNLYLSVATQSCGLEKIRSFPPENRQNRIHIREWYPNQSMLDMISIAGFERTLQASSLDPPDRNDFSRWTAAYR